MQKAKGIGAEEKRTGVEIRPIWIFSSSPIKWVVWIYSLLNRKADSAGNKLLWRRHCRASRRMCGGWLIQIQRIIMGKSSRWLRNKEKGGEQLKSGVSWMEKQRKEMIAKREKLRNDRSLWHLVVFISWRLLCNHLVLSARKAPQQHITVI